MPTIKDVAELAGVSTATVSHFINRTKNLTPETRLRVEQAIVKLGFTPNSAGRSLALQKFNGKSSVTFADGEIHAGRSAVTYTQTFRIRTTASVMSPDISMPTRTSRTLLRLVRSAQPISRVELARRLGVNRSTVTTILKPFIESGVVREGHSMATGRTMGRPRVALTFNGDREYFAGVNLGVRGSQVGIATLDGAILAEEDVPTLPDSQATLSGIRAALARLRAKSGARELKSIAVSVPGPTDADRSKLLYAPHLGWRDVAVADALKFPEEGIPVIVENDATAAALYEARLHLKNAADETVNNFLLVRSGTGIGVGLVVSGEVYRGSDTGTGMAGEFGHMTIVAGGKPCVCGNRGCWERYASASAAASLYMGDRPSFGTATAPRFVEIVARAEAGEPRAKSTLERMGEYLGIGIGNVITGMGVPHVILSGRIVYGWKFIKDPLREAVGNSMAGKLFDWSVEPGEPRGAGLGGALEVAVEEYLMSSFAFH